MRISASKVQNLCSKEIISPTYRVNSSYENRGIVSNRYKYYSLTINHHLYFLVKKIFRLIEANYDIHINNPRDRFLVDKISEVINYLSAEEDFQIVCRYLWTDSTFYKMLLDNAYSNKSSHRENVIEIVDKNEYGGGLGLKDLWLSLFDILTFCEKEHIISKVDVINYLKTIKDLINMYGSGGLKKYKLETSGILSDTKSSIIVRDGTLIDQSDEIKNTMDLIIANNLYHSKSILKKCPEEVIGDLVSSYKMNKSLVLKSIKK